MCRKVFFTGLSLLVLTGLALAQEEKAESKQVSGTVKAVATDSLTVTDDAGKEWSFVITEDTTVVAEGASHKMKAAEEAGESTMITDFVKEKQKVVVKYQEADGKLNAKEIRVK